MQHTGGCHCGKVKYEVDMEIDSVLSCNCSICSKKGSLLAFTPAENFKLLQGEDALGEYMFNKHAIHHFFCKNCGIAPFARAKAPDGKDTVAINVRCVDDVDIKALPVKEFDGKSV